MHPGSAARAGKLTLVAAAAGLVLAGCGSPIRPQVTFYAAGKSIAVGPTHYCDVKLEKECAANSNALGRLRVPADRPLQISVPGSVSEALWLVVFQYRTAEGKQVTGRSDLFGQDERMAYTLRLPPGAQLEIAEVQQVSATLLAGADREVDFAIRAIWAVSAS